MIRKVCLSLLLVLLLAAQAIEAAEVKNVQVQQAGNRGQFTYDLVGDEAEAEVVIVITVQGKSYAASDLHLEGDLGKVRPGRGRTIYWNILQDFPRGLNAEIAWRITSGGGADFTAGGVADFTDPLTGMEFIRVNGGCYRMGDTFGDGESDEKPVHEVCVNDFYIGKYEVTVEQFRKFINDTGYRTEAEKSGGCHSQTGPNLGFRSHVDWREPGFNQQDSHPVVCVSWNDATAFSQWQSRKSELGKVYRLPTEAEWEYAAKSGGRIEKWAGTSRESSLGEYAWYDENSGSKTHPAGQKLPNGLGLHDMSGNVWEWCSDWYENDYYENSPRDNPGGPSYHSFRVNRGGSWSFNAAYTRASNRRGGYPVKSNRRGGYPVNRSDSLGFRLALPPGQ